GGVGAGVLAFGGGQAPQPAPSPAPAQARTLADDQAGEADPPLEGTFIENRGGKPPMRFYDVVLNLHNHRHRPMWLVMRDDGQTPLWAEGVSPTDDPRPQVFVGKAYDGAKGGGEGKVVEIVFLGDSGFRAFYLPPRAS